MKPLPSECRWIEWEPGYATLEWNYGCVAAVRQRDSYIETRVAWQRSEHYGRAGSMAQGRRFVERWISARKGFPGYVSRNPIRGWESIQSIYKPGPQPNGNLGRVVDGCEPAWRRRR